MSDIQQLQRQFNVRGVQIEAGAGGLPRVVVSTPRAEAHIYLHGAHVTHFQARGGPKTLFLSAKSHFEAGKAIRGGVPVIFPWFGPKAGDKAAPMHGFARTTEWDLTDIRAGGDGSIAVALELRSSDATRAWWPHQFHLRYIVTVDSFLDLTLEAHNDSVQPFSFEEALHTYLSVGDVRRVQVQGLKGREYLDKTDGMRRKTETQTEIAIVSETDRVYLNTTDRVSVADPALDRKLIVDKDGSLATVLWNPWRAKAKAMSDFGDDEWPAMLCVETANAADNIITLAPGQHNQMKVSLDTASIRASGATAPTRQWEMTGAKDQTTSRKPSPPARD